MKRTVLLVIAFAWAVIPLVSQTPGQKPSFEVVSIKPSAPDLMIRGGGARGDRYTMSGATLKMLVQRGYSPANNGAPGVQIQVIGGPSWIDSDRYDVQAKADCSGGSISPEQLQLMIQSMLEDRFQLKAHKETRELPIYNLVVGKDGPKLKAAEDQTPSPLVAAGPPQPCGPAPNVPAPPPPPGATATPFGPIGPGQRGGPGPLPRGALRMMMGPAGLTLESSAINIAGIVGVLQQFAGRPVIDKTDLKGLYDVKLQFSAEGLALPGLGGGPGPGPAGFGPAGPGPGTAPTAADPNPSLFTAIQELGLRLESTKGPVEVIVVDSAQKPTEN